MPPVERISTPRSARNRPKDSKPALSETEIRALRMRMRSGGLTPAPYHCFACGDAIARAGPHDHAATFPDQAVVM